ncbi:exosome complex exonuclease Rrp41 [Candidatus Woesearchaeota archaeon]|nr:exosome complex exonuclease Rrp41 [Candidatus Woesearchaeota archaeon]
MDKNSDKRTDGRKPEELRPISARVGIIRKADGSAMFRIGDTIAYAAVYGPRELYPKFMQDPTKGILRCRYNMMPFSGSGDRVRPGPSRRSTEISLVTEKALLPVLNLEEFPNAVLDVFIDLPQTDAGTRCAGICAASMALADAGIFMRDMVSAVAVGMVNGRLLADLSYEEESTEGEVSDMPVAFTPKTGELTLLQLDGGVTKTELIKALELGRKVCREIYSVQKATLKEKYSGESGEED